MAKIKIVKVPDGEAPLEIRQKWVGTIIPLAENLPPGLVVAGVISGKRVNAGYNDGYHVETIVAIQALEKKNPETAEWWLTNTIVGFMPYLVFRRVECELVP